MDYLAKQGGKLLERNYHCRFGEVDIIAIEANTILFIEVRYRKNEKYMSVVETINQKKCNKIVMTSQYYLTQHKRYRNCQFRYDVITMTGELDRAEITWIKDAFQA